MRSLKRNWAEHNFEKYMNQSSSSNIRFQPNRATFVALAAITVLVIAISIFCLSSGYSIIFQNLFYIPIIIACAYYAKRGLAFSVVIAGVYFFLVTLFTRESVILLEALIRVLIFVLIASLLTYLSLVRKLAEEALRENEKKFKNIIKTVSDWVWEVDEKGQYTYSSSRVKDLLGYEASEVLGKTPFDLMPKDEAEKIGKIFGDIIQKKEPFPWLENWNVHKNGTKVLLETSGIPILDKKGNLKGYRGIDRDITERKKAELGLQSKVKELNEARLILLSLAEDIQKEKEGVEIKVKERTREIKQEQAKLVASINSLTVGFLLLDLNDKVLLKNPAVSRILEIPESEVAIDRIKKYFEGIVDLEACHNQCVIEKKTVGIKNVAKGNKFLSLLLTPVVMLKDSEEVIGHIFLIEDITEQKLLDQMRTEIVSTTSHQLRTPLSVIKGNLEMLLAGDFGKIEKKQKEILEEAFLGNERMIKLVNGLMDVTKITEGKLELKLVPKKLEELVAESVKELIPFAEKNNASLSYAPPSNSLPEVNVDSGRIKQLLQNLIENAIKYRRPDIKGKVLVEIKKDKTGRFLETSVKDNGAGIPKMEQKKVFERFFRASNVIRMDPGSGAGPGGGTGLGLYIANAVIEQSGGKLWFESEGEDKGTTFYFKLPIKK